MVYGVSTMLGRLLNYLLVPLYTRIFLPEEYGVVTEFYAYAGFFAVLFLYGMETAFFRFSKENAAQDKVFSTAFLSVLVSSLVLGGSLLFFKHDIYEFIGYKDTQYFIEYFVAIIVLDTLTALPFAKLRLLSKAFQFAFIRLISIFFNIALNLFFLILCPYLISEGFHFVELFYFEDLGVSYIFISNVLASGFTLIALLPVIIFTKWEIEIALLKKMLKYALPLLIVGVAGVINEIADRILLKKLLPFSFVENLKWVGIYGANYKLSILISLFTQAYRYAAEPLFFSQSTSKDAPKFYAESLRVFVVVQFIILSAILFHLEGLKYFIGQNYWEGISIIGILLFANIALGINYNLSIWYKLTDKTHYAAYIALFGALITISANFVLIPIMGIHGAAYATLLCYVSMMLLTIILGYRYYPIPYPWIKLIKWLILFGILYSIGHLSSHFVKSAVMAQIIKSTLFSIYFLAIAWTELRFKKAII